MNLNALSILKILSVILNGTHKGKKLSKKMLKLDDNRPSPRIFNEFAAAAFRYGHSAQADKHVTKDTKYNDISEDRLSNLYFDPHFVIVDGPGAACRGAMTEHGIKPGTHWVKEIVKLFDIFYSYFCMKIFGKFNAY